MIVTVPVQEGKQFRIGSLKLKGNTVLPEDRLRKLYEEVKLGKVYNYTAVENGSESVRTLYQARGYIYAYTVRSLSNAPASPASSMSRSTSTRAIASGSVDSSSPATRRRRTRSSGASSACSRATG